MANPGAGWASSKHDTDCDCCPKKFSITDDDFDGILEALSSLNSGTSKVNGASSGVFGSSFVETKREPEVCGDTKSLVMISNLDLSSESRNRRKALKKKAKSQQRAKRVETRALNIARWAHANSPPKPPPLGHSSAAAAGGEESGSLNKLDRRSRQSPGEILSHRDAAVKVTVAAAQELLSHPLYASQPGDAQEAGSKLLRHMAKATQTLGMMVPFQSRVEDFFKHGDEGDERDDNRGGGNSGVGGGGGSDEGKDLAVWGYTKHKFAKRAMLTFDTLHALRPKRRRPHQHTRPLPASQGGTHSSPGTEGGTEGGGDDDDDSPGDALWQDLVAVKTVVSVGGGPGNDLFGAWLLLEMAEYEKELPLACSSCYGADDSNPHQKASGGSAVPLPPLDKTPREYICLDFAQPAWVPVVDHLRNILSAPDFFKTRLHPRAHPDYTKHAPQVPTAEAAPPAAAAESTPPFPKRNGDTFVCQYCDITLALVAQTENADALKAVSRAGLVLVSYVLRETHGKWHRFMKEAWELALPGCLFLLSEPTVWQHHILLGMLNGDPPSDHSNAKGGKECGPTQGEAPVRRTATSRLQVKHLRYWWLDGLGSGDQEAHVLSRESGNESMVRNGPGVLLIQKPRA